MYSSVGLHVDLLRGPDLDELAAVHDRDPVAHRAHDGEVVRDEQVGQPELVLEVLEKVEDLRLDRDVERRHGLVADDELRVQRERPRDPDPLPLAAGELVRVAVDEARVEADDVEELAHAGAAVAARADAVHDERLRDDVADGHARVERRVRVLEDDLHLAPHLPHVLAAERRQLPPLEADRAAGRLEQAEDAVAGRGLAGAGLADEAERLALADLEADAVHGPDEVDRPVDQQARLDREVLLEVGDLEERRAVRAHETAPAGSREPARSQVGWAERTQWPEPHLAQLRRLGRARVVAVRVRAPRREAARRRRRDQVGRPAGDRGEAPAADALALDLRQRPEQRLGVRVLGPVEEVERQRVLDDLAGVHHDDVVCRLGDDAHVVGDDDHRHVVALAQVFEDVEDLRLDGHVERRRRLVGDQQLRVAGEGDRDHHALPHPAREPVRIVVEALRGLRNPHLLQELDRALPGRGLVAGRGACG